jgi:hypothetical protein
MFKRTRSTAHVHQIGSLTQDADETVYADGEHQAVRDPAGEDLVDVEVLRASGFTVEID